MAVKNITAIIVILNTFTGAENDSLPMNRKVHVF